MTKPLDLETVVGTLEKAASSSFPGSLIEKFEAGGRGRPDPPVWQWGYPNQSRRRSLRFYQSKEIVAVIVVNIKVLGGVSHVEIWVVEDPEGQFSWFFFGDFSFSRDINDAAMKLLLA